MEGQKQYKDETVQVERMKMIRDDGRRRSRKMKGRQKRGSGRWQGKKKV